MFAQNGKRAQVLMANNKTLLKAIEQCDKRIARAKNKKRWSRSWEDKEAAESMIAEQESKKLRLQQQIRFNNVQRDKKTKGVERVHDAIEVNSGCGEVGFGAPW